MAVTRNIPEIIAENKKRNALLDAPYNPVTGEGSFMPRKEIRYKDKGQEISFLAPAHMLDFPVIQRLIDCGSVEKLVKSVDGNYTNQLHARMQKELLELRLKEDFEFYTYTCVKIPAKDTEELIPFKQNRPQRRLLVEFEKQRLANKPIRVIIDKARQWGGSTESQIYMNHIQLFHRKRWNMAICTLVDPQAVHIRQMLNTTLENFPESVAKFTLSNYGAFNSKNKKINERDCIIGVGSTERPENLRTYNFRMLHLSETGSWKDTPGKSAKALAQSLRGSIRPLPYTMVVMESTAKGVGNFFHDEWMAAIEGRSSYAPVFVPWFEIEMYREKITDYKEFIAGMTEYGWNLWDLGATLEGINWYFRHKTGENMSDLAMFQEMPSTWRESFESTGRPAFNKIHINNQYKHCRPPVFRGDIRGKSVKGKSAFEKIEFVSQVNGDLHIWEYPDTTINVKNRYCGWLDIGGTTHKADYSCLKVIDRYWMMEGLKPEVVAMLHSHLDADLLAWKAAQVMWMYGKGLLAVEIQSLLNRKGQEEVDVEHSFTVLDKIAPFYPNLFARTSPDDIRKGIPAKWGWVTTRLNKPMIIDLLNECLRDELYYERDSGSLDEMYYYEIKDDGKLGAADGKKDDKVMSTAGGLYLALSYLPKPVEIKEEQRSSGRRVISEASI
jgi:hypothetical protein